MLRTVSIIPGIENFAPGAHRDQQRVLRVAEPAADLVLQRAQRPRHLHPQLRRHRAVGQVAPAGLGGDREARRHRQPQPGHLGQVGALAAEQVLLVLAALGELVHVLLHQRPPHAAVGEGTGHTPATSSVLARPGPVKDGNPDRPTTGPAVASLDECPSALDDPGRGRSGGTRPAGTPRSATPSRTCSATSRRPSAAGSADRAAGAGELAAGRAGPAGPQPRSSASRGPSVPTLATLLPTLLRHRGMRRPRRCWPRSPVCPTDEVLRPRACSASWPTGTTRCRAGCRSWRTATPAAAGGGGGARARRRGQHPGRGPAAGWRTSSPPWSTSTTTRAPVVKDGSWCRCRSTSWSSRCSPSPTIPDTEAREHRPGRRPGADHRGDRARRPDLPAVRVRQLAGQPPAGRVDGRRCCRRAASVTGVPSGTRARSPSSPSASSASAGRGRVRRSRPPRPARVAALVRHRLRSRRPAELEPDPRWRSCCWTGSPARSSPRPALPGQGARTAARVHPVLPPRARHPGRADRARPSGRSTSSSAEYQRLVRSPRPQGPAALLAAIGRLPRVRSTPEDELAELHEIMLDALRRAVGRRAGACPARRRPRCRHEEFDWAGIARRHARPGRPRCSAWSTAAAPTLLDAEFRTACRRLLARAAGTGDPDDLPAARPGRHRGRGRLLGHRQGQRAVRPAVGTAPAGQGPERALRPRRRPPSRSAARRSCAPSGVEPR